MSNTTNLVFSEYLGNGVDDTFAITFDVIASEYSTIKAVLYQIEDPVGTPIDPIVEQTPPIKDGVGTYDYSIATSPLRAIVNTPIPDGYKIVFYRQTGTISAVTYNDFRFPYKTVQLDLDRLYQLVQENAEALRHYNLTELFDLPTTGGTKFQRMIKTILDDVILATPGLGGSVEFDIDFTVLGVTQGAYSDGSLIPAGTPILDVVKNMLTQIIPPTYTAPTVSLAGSGPFIVESGTSINPTMTPTFNQNDAGASTNYELFRGGVSIYTNATPTATAGGPFTPVDQTINFNCQVTYADGPVKNDNAGNPDPTGQILSGTIASTNVSYTGARNAFYQINGDIVNIRSNSNTRLNPGNGTVVTFSGSGNNFVFAYPDSLSTINSVSMVSSGFTFDITADTTLQASQLVNDASGGNAVLYKVYRFQPASPFTSATFTITI